MLIFTCLHQAILSIRYCFMCCLSRLPLAALLQEISILQEIPSVYCNFISYITFIPHFLKVSRRKEKKRSILESHKKIIFFNINVQILDFLACGRPNLVETLLSIAKLHHFGTFFTWISKNTFHALQNCMKKWPARKVACP